METSPYLTDCGAAEKETPLPTQQKFVRFSQTNVNPLTPLNTQSVHKLTNTSSNCFRLHKKNFAQFPPEEYYDCKKAKPGIHFYRTILEANERIKNSQKIPPLQINIPHTLIMADNSFHIIQSSNARVSVLEDVNHLDFLQIIKKEGDKNALYPASLIANGNGTFFDFTVYLSNELDSRIYPKNENQVSIAYIHPHGQTPNILRLYYTPARIKGAKPSHAYKIINFKPLSDEIYSRKHKLIHNYVVDCQKQESIKVTPVRGKALQELQAMAQSIINFLEYLKKVQVTEIVVDFSMGADHCYYFHEIKSIKSLNLNRLWDVGAEEQISVMTREKNNQMYCKLCGFSYSKAEMGHIVTNKLILELIAHMKSRGEKIEAPLLRTTSSATHLSGSSHVCSLCYDLVTAEHQLINLEHEFSCLLNMNSDPIERVPDMLDNLQSIPMIDSNKIVSEIFNITQPHCNPFQIINQSVPQVVKETDRQTKMLYQWRLFFYIEEVKNIPNKLKDEDSFSLSLGFSDAREVFVGLQDTYTQPGLVSYDKQKESRLGSTRVQSAGSCSTIKRSQCTSRLDQSHANLKSSFSNYQSKLRKMNNSYRPQTPCSKGSLGHKEDVQDFSEVIEPTNQKTTLSVQKVKLMILYTTTPNIKEIMNSNTLKFELKSSNSKRELVMKGESATLQNFSNKSQCQRHSCEVLLFDEEYTYANLELNVGLICDGLSELHKGVEKSSNDDRLYFPNRMHRNCKPLPAEWIEVLTETTTKYVAPSRVVSKKSSSVSSRNVLRVNRKGGPQQGRLQGREQSSLLQEVSAEWNITEGTDEQEYL